ncbi:cysteine desulfurase [Streptococcus dysgalactiae subsp. dysgalactiae]|uniref:Cysteine desulfurase n=2 Tax=Streptococcus dysgalactiae TaxID=1334 RepID=A0A380JUW3_STRDY|nr:cysteine desulfurase family protein [Streptococcus dysgalactiae]EFY02437.1 cysteine desulfurase / selenocysteine lyase [Streptococcus dysgalactiae subsp. dysgalactiae ATCC 27957]MCB2832632.1 cysteine desulfurase [Streptococcus dysgalactiae subsp. dysgalactiae]MCB2840526.1 cysteine desulfurase [Streptococcus dysgalactiae subsp. dysgalactiae]MCB2844347.1 cysteine desulfurase [Streptococcus dysgalactiae subsp. dysgalactiae]MCB2846657.1 cysteine desulfurase [Streptococcus dysgalactiae subsp. dy
MIYFDNAATTIPYGEALRTYQEVATKIYGNPSSLHQLGTNASRILEASRKQVAGLLGVKSEEIFFTSGGTESDNWAIKGIAFEKAAFGKHIIVSAIEHPAVTESAKWLSSQGFEVTYAPVTARGIVDVEALAELLRPDTILVSIMAVNNEMGAIQPIQAISKMLANYPTITFHVDAVQAIGKIPTTTYLTERVDLASFSGHKFHAVRGVGFLYKKSGKRLTPLLTGGGQEQEMRSTTENVAGIASMAKALRMVTEKETLALSRLKAMREVIYQALSGYQDVTLFSGQEGFAPNIITFGIKDVRGEVIVHAFETHDIYISTTSACSSKAGKPAGSLVAMGVPVKAAQTAVRISLDDDNDMGQVEQFLTIFKQIYDKTQKVR